MDRPLSPLEDLAIADPRAAERMIGHLTGKTPSTDTHSLSLVVNEVIEALAIEITFGRTLADGMGRMMAVGTPAGLDRYRSLVKAASARGPTLAGLFARHLVPVLTCGDKSLAHRFEKTTRLMLKKGTYTLNAPLEVLSWLIERKEMACAHAYLDLLDATYRLDTSYNRTVYLTHTLPRAVEGFPPARRLWQIRGLARVIRVDERLADEYLQGLTAGLHLLSERALNDFLDQAIRRYRQAPDPGARFLSLESRLAVEICRERQVAVPLSAVQPRLERYLHARIGQAVAVRPLSSLPANQSGKDAKLPLVRCDGRVIYLPDEMDLMDERKGNAALYQLLAGLEAGAIEFGTYDLDVDKAMAGQPNAPSPDMGDNPPAESDLSRFLRGFEDPILALDLFTLFEHGRVARMVGRRYPACFAGSQTSSPIATFRKEAVTASAAPGFPSTGTWSWMKS